MPTLVSVPRLKSRDLHNDMWVVMQELQIQKTTKYSYELDITKHRAGVAGFHIEDQLQTKRCGHLLGKQLVDGPEFIQRIKAAVYGRNSIPGGSDIVNEQTLS